MNLEKNIGQSLTPKQEAIKDPELIKALDQAKITEIAAVLEDVDPNEEIKKQAMEDFEEAKKTLYEKLDELQNKRSGRPKGYLLKKWEVQRLINDLKTGLLGDSDAMSKIVNDFPKMLGEASDEIKNDPDIVRKAIKSGGYDILQYASPEIQKMVEEARGKISERREKEDNGTSEDESKLAEIREKIEQT
jgi:hypothetical protein